MEKNNNILFFIGLEQDITERKIAETKLLESNKRLEESEKAMVNVMEDLESTKSQIEVEKAKDEAILTSIGDGLVAINENGQVILINKAGCDLLGFKREELLGKKFIDVVEMTDKDVHTLSKDQRPFKISISHSKSTTTTTTESAYHYIRKDGTQIPVAITVTPIILNDKINGAIEVFRDITHDKEVDKAKSEFVSFASHQLRTPLTSINWYLETLMSEDKAKLNDDQKEYANEAYLASKRMGDLINALLNVSRIEMGTFRVELEPTDLVALAKAARRDFEQKIEERKLQFDEIFDKNIDKISTDPNLLSIIFQNLLSDSIKYTPTGGKITLRIEKQKDTILITVADTGMGIPKEAKDRIFEKLFRADNAKKVDPDGTGLGLYIVKAIVDQFGGTIRFESEENKGTTFYVTIPMSGMKAKKGTKNG